MEVKELRIGNLIQLYRKPEDQEKTAHIVFDVYRDNENYYVGLEDGFYVNIDKGIEPIPITEKWLDRLGFEYGDICDLGVRSNGQITYSFGTAYMCDMFETGCGFKAKCEYVHQLQNLYFALTGEELEIKNN